MLLFLTHSIPAVPGTSARFACSDIGHRSDFWFVWFGFFHQTGSRGRSQPHLVNPSLGMVRAEQGMSGWGCSAAITPHFLLGLSITCFTVIQFPLIPQQTGVMGVVKCGAGMDKRLQQGSCSLLLVPSTFAGDFQRVQHGAREGDQQHLPG